MYSSAQDINQHIQANRRRFAQYYSDLLEQFAFLSNLRFYLVGALILSNISNFSRTKNPVSLMINIPSIILVLIYPWLRERKIIGDGRAEYWSFLLMMVFSLQWSLSAYVVIISNPSYLTPSLVSPVVSIFWVFSLGSQRVFNYIKAMLATGFFASMLFLYDRAYLQQFSSAIIMGIIMGICFNYAFDMTLRFRYFAIDQQRLLRKKTTKIESIFQSSPIAFFTVNSDLTLGEDISPALKLMIGPTAKSGMPLAEVFQQTSLSQAELQTLFSILQTSIGENVMSFNLNESHLPRSFKIAERKIRASYRPLVLDDELVYDVLVALDDISEVESQILSQRFAEAEGQTLLQFVRTPAVQARLFIECCGETNRAMRRLKNPADFPAVLRLLHTLKGNARSLGMPELSQIVHKLEDVCKGFGAGSVMSESLAQAMSPLHMLLDQLDRFYNEVFAQKSQQAPFDLKEFLRELIGKSALEACRITGKSLPRIELACGPIADSDKLRKLLFGSIPHLVNNAIDHGLEPDISRLAAGKSREGCLRVSLEQHGSVLHLKFQDDGRGLNLKKIRDKAGKTSLTDEEITSTVLGSGFTTSETLTTLSGRGIGLDAVVEQAAALHGVLRLDLKIDNTDFCPFIIHIEIPSRELK